MKDLKTKVLEISDIAKACPENFQNTCFELLLNHYLNGLTQEVPVKKEKEETMKKLGDNPVDNNDKIEKPSESDSQEDIKNSDLHVKARHFLSKGGISLEFLNNLFYKEGEKILPLFDDLKTTKLAESQIRITLMQALVKAITSGEFQANVDNIREECKQRKCYDSSNFSAYFRYHKALFDFTKFDSDTRMVRLSDQGKKALADLMKELQ